MDVNFKIIPNPAKEGNINLKISGLELNKEVLIVVRDILGRELYSKIIIINNTVDNMVAIDSNHRLSSGTYIIVGSSDNTIFNKKLIVK